MGEKSLVSVIIPTYNRPTYLLQAVRSVLDQTYPHLELIIVDDGSDNDGKANREILSPHMSSLTYTCQKNQGIGAAVNKALSLAKGEYIQRLDDDDMLAREKIERCVDIFQNKPSVGLVATGYHVTDEKGNITRTQKPLHYPQKARFLFMLMASIAVQPSVMVRKSCYDKVGLYRTDILAEDYEMWIRIAREYEIATTDEPLVFYRRHSDNITRVKSKEYFERDTIQFIKHYLEDATMKELIPHIKKEACGYIFKTITYLMHDGVFVRTVDLAQEQLNKAKTLNPDEPLIHLWEIVLDIHRNENSCSKSELASLNLGEYEQYALSLIDLREKVRELKKSGKQPTSPEMSSFRARYTGLRSQLIAKTYRRAVT